MFGFLEKNNSAVIAKNRLTIAIMSDRERMGTYPFMDEMKAEIIAVVKKYIGVRTIEVRKEISGEFEGISIDVELGENKK
jgi:cell division topological specificity factor MinE